MESKIDIGTSIWEEMNIAKTYVLHILHYNNYQRKKKRSYDIFLLAIAIIITIISLLRHYENFTTLLSFIPSYATEAIAVLALLFDKIKEPLKLYFQPEDELVELDKIATYYADYFTKLEEIYIALSNNTITHEDACNSYFREKAEINKHLSSLNKYLRFIKKHIAKKSQEEAQLYIEHRLK